jgi:hypothetical protein
VETFARRNKKFDYGDRSSLKIEMKSVDKFKTEKRIERFVFELYRTIGSTYLVDNKLRIIFQHTRKNYLRETRMDISYTQEKYKRPNWRKK